MVELKIRLQDDLEQVLFKHHDELHQFNTWDDYQEWLKNLVKNDIIILKLSAKEIVK